MQLLLGRGSVKEVLPDFFSRSCSFARCQATGKSSVHGTLHSSVFRLDQSNYYAYFYLKEKHLSRAHQTWQAVSYRYCDDFSKIFRTTFLSRDPKFLITVVFFTQKMGNIQLHYINLVS